MGRSTRSELTALLQDARGLEALASQADIGPDRLDDYWALASDLVVLVTDIEAQTEGRSQSGLNDADILALRRRLRDVAARLSLLILE